MKREKFLWPLTQSHHRGLMAARRIKDALLDPSSSEEGDWVKVITSELRELHEDELEKHFWDEERILCIYEGRMGTGEPEPDRIRKDHRRLESLLVQGGRKELLHFAELLVDHIRFEEEVLFKRIEQVLTDGEKMEVESILTGTSGKKRVGKNDQ